jgi:hypothetical protein
MTVPIETTPHHMRKFSYQANKCNKETWAFSRSAVLAAKLENFFRRQGGLMVPGSNGAPHQPIANSVRSKVGYHLEWLCTGGAGLRGTAEVHKINTGI